MPKKASASARALALWLICVSAGAGAQTVAPLGEEPAMGQGALWELARGAPAPLRWGVNQELSERVSLGLGFEARGAQPALSAPIESLGLPLFARLSGGGQATLGEALSLRVEQAIEIEAQGPARALPKLEASLALGEGAGAGLTVSSAWRGWGLASEGSEFSAEPGDWEQAAAELGSARASSRELALWRERAGARWGVALFDQRWEGAQMEPEEQGAPRCSEGVEMSASASGAQGALMASLLMMRAQGAPEPGAKRPTSARVRVAGSRSGARWKLGARAQASQKAQGIDLYARGQGPRGIQAQAALSLARAAPSEGEVGGSGAWGKIALWREFGRWVAGARVLLAPKLAQAGGPSAPKALGVSGGVSYALPQGGRLSFELGAGRASGVSAGLAGDGAPGSALAAGPARARVGLEWRLR